MDTSKRINADPNARFSEEEIRLIDSVLANAWSQRSGTGGRDGRSRNPGTPERRQRLGWFDSLDGYGTLDPAEDLPTPGITCLDGQTIHCQAAQSYTQWVPLDDADAAQSICPIGHSDRPDSPYRTSNLSLWGEAKLHPAPLTRKAVEKIAAARKVLTK